MKKFYARKMISNVITKVLKTLAEVLNEAAIEWYVTGKVNLALQGVDVTPSRIVILIRDTALDRFLSLFAHYERNKIEKLENGEALEFSLFIDGVEVLVCAEYPHGSYWASQTTSCHIFYEGLSLPCFSLEDERKAYDKIGLYTN